MGSSEILSQYNAVKAQIDALNYDDILNKQKEKNAANKQADIDAFSSGKNSHINSTYALYEKSINDANVAYDNHYQKNAVQKMINEKQIAERNSNLGLTDSGLNRTQQTATQLSYANQKSSLDIARQGILDDLETQLANAITQLQNEKSSGIRSIENEWDSYSETQAQNIYNTQYNGYVDMLNDLGNQYNDALQLEQQQEEEKRRYSYNIGNDNYENNNNSTNNDKESFLLYKWKGETVVDESGNTLLKYTGNNGKYYNIMPGKNPYTNTFNAKISQIIDGKCVIDSEWRKKNQNSANAIVRSCALYGVFSNGYQPKGVCYYDGNGEMVDAGSLTATTRKDYMNGNLQTVWYTKKTNKYWIWDGSKNEYLLYEF